MEGPGWALSAVATPGHTSNHLCYALEGGSGALFTGDHVMGWSTTVISPPDGDMSDYMASLDLLLDRRRTRSIFRRTARRSTSRIPTSAALIAHRRMREKQILARLERRARA